MWSQEGTPLGITATLIAAFSGLMALMGWLLKHLMTTTIPEQTEAATAALATIVTEFGKLREQFDQRQQELLKHCENESSKEREGSERRYTSAIAEMKEIHQSILNQGAIQSQLLSLIQQRTRLSDVVESAEDAIWSKTTDGVIVSWNRAAEKLLGWTAQEMIGRSIYSVVPPTLHDEERQTLAKVAKGERVDNYNTVRLHRGGRRISLSVTSSPIKDPSGLVVGISTIAREV